MISGFLGRVRAIPTPVKWRRVAIRFTDRQRFTISERLIHVTGTIGNPRREVVICRRDPL